MGVRPVGVILETVGFSSGRYNTLQLQFPVLSRHLGFLIKVLLDAGLRACTDRRRLVPHSYSELNPSGMLFCKRMAFAYVQR